MAALGYCRRSTLPFTRDEVTANLAKMVRLLYDSLDKSLDLPEAVRPAYRSDGRPVTIHDEEAESYARSLLEQGYQSAHVAKRTGLSMAIVSCLQTTVIAGNGR